MKKLFLLIPVLTLVQASFCQKTSSQKIDELMSAYCKVNKFNGTVLVSQKGKVLLEKGYGVMDAHQNIPNNTQSIFQTYSITKSFTSTAIMKLTELKKLSLTDNLSKFYPGFPKGDSITIEHLLTHTSGIYDYTKGNDMPDQTEQSFIKFIETKPLDFSPGTGWNYSNSGYWLLGFIIRKVTGIPYEQVIKKYIFEPLGMSKSGFDFKYLSDNNKTIGYALFSKNYKREAKMFEPPAPFAAGAIYSTAHDLYKFHKGLQSFAIISKSSQEKGYTPFRNNYGYGWQIDSIEGRRLVSHSGGAAGYRSNFARIPQDDICIVLLSNNENSSMDLITKNILNILFDKTYKIPFEIKLSPDTLNYFTGTFSVNPSFTMYVTLEDGQLMTQVSGQKKIALLAEKENYFFAEEANGFLKFGKDSTGNYNLLTIYQRGRELKAKRIYPTWGLMGTATERGWEESTPDIQLTRDSANTDIWRINNITLKSGLIIFRLNNDWGYHYGDNDNDKILDMYGADIKVEAGTYNIVLDLTNQVEPKYSFSREN